MQPLPLLSASQKPIEDETGKHICDFWIHIGKQIPQLYTTSEHSSNELIQLIPQTVFSCTGSYGVGRGALICLTARRRCGGAVLLVIYMVW